MTAFPTWLLPDAAILHCDEVVAGATDRTRTLSLRTCQLAAPCPQCHQPSKRVHSRYTRQIADLPLAGIQIMIVLRSRRFFCDQSACTQQIFTERLPSVVPPRGRRTNRLAATHQRLALALGGNGGARLANTLGMAVGRDRLIKDIRALPLPSTTSATVIRIDDWAMRKGQTYGTIVVDLETRRPLDLLPDRSADTVAAWLEDHPTITHLSRDRAVSYSDAAWRGAPQAQQIADRWHLLKNMSDALIAVCDGHQRAIDAAVSGPPEEGCPADLPPGREPDPRASPRPSLPPAAPTPRELRHTTIHHRHTIGWTQRAIAAEVGLHPKTVSRPLRAPLGAVPQRLPRRTCLDPYLPYLVQRWEAGCTNAHQLFVEIQAQGFPASHSTVREWAGRRRKEQGLPSIVPAQIRAGAPTRTTTLHRRTLVAWVMRRPDTATPRQETQIA